MELETLVHNFRKAIEAAQANYEPGEFFRKFPTGQCGHTSDMLAQYLIDNGIGPITYVMAHITVMILRIDGATPG